MTDIKETSQQQLRHCSWWGGAGDALPEIYVEQLITEIDRLNKIIDHQRHEIGKLQAPKGRDPQKMKLLAEVLRLTGENIELERKLENIDLQEKRSQASKRS